MPSQIPDYDLAVLRSTYREFGTHDSEWARGCQSGMRLVAQILGFEVEEDVQ